MHSQKYSLLKTANSKINCVAWRAKRTHEKCRSKGLVIEEASKSLKGIDERVLINFRDKNAPIATFRDKNGVFDFYEKYHDIS